MTLAFTPGGTLWAGSYPHGLFRIDAKSGAVQAQYGNPEFGTPWIFGLLADRSGALWVSTFRGLFRSVGKGRGLHFERQVLPQDSPRESFEQCLQDRRGRIWAPGALGLGVLDRGQWRRVTPRDGLKSAHIGAMAEAPDGAI